MNLARSCIRCCCIALTVLFSGQCQLLAQITITQNSFKSSLQEKTPVTQFLSYDGEQIFDLIEISGANQVWDFTALEITEEKEGFFSVIGSIDDQPGNDDDHLGRAENVLISDFPIFNPEIGEGAIFYEIYYTHLLYDGSKVVKLGEIRVEGDDVNPDREDEHYITWMDPGQTWLDFPVIYQKSWESSYKESYSDIFITIETDEEVEVDGWGTMITSGGSIDVLRIRRNLRSRLFGVIHENIAWFDFFDASGRLVASITGFFPTFDDEDDDYYELETTWNVFSTTTSISQGEKKELPSGVTLHQNYPNPFNPATRIDFYLPEATDILLTVHDLLGRKVATLAQGPAASGEHSRVFNAASLSSGVYIYRLSAGDQTVTRRLTLLK